MASGAFLTAPSTDQPAMETTLEIENQKKNNNNKECRSARPGGSGVLVASVGLKGTAWQQAARTSPFSMVAWQHYSVSFLALIPEGASKVSFPYHLVEDCPVWFNSFF